MSANNGTNKLEVAQETLALVTAEIKLAQTKADLDQAVHRLETALMNYRSLKDADVEHP